MRQPLGREFNTAAAFAELTRPAVVAAPGTVIAPLRFSAAAANDAARAPRGAKRAPVVTVAGGARKRAKARA
jgi:hypothetical protein